jgi:AcrR family transcriptional regulator
MLVHMQERPVEEILDAALDQFRVTGVRRTSADDIARRAGVNRATLYRRVGTKDEIVRATYVHEAQRVLAHIERETGPVPDPVPDPGAGDFDPVEYVAQFFTVSISALRENKLLRQLLEIDPDETLAGLTLRAGEVLTLAATLAADRMRRLRAHVGNTDVGDIEDLAGTFGRIAQSLLLTPDAPPRLETEAQMRDYARRVIAPMVLGR